ncbi:MAG: LutC/YkgG family protein [Acetobacteraceae bacterium]
MSREAILGSIRRNLRRGALPADQQAMLAGRLALHPRGPIPARSLLARGGRIALFLERLEKEYASFARVADLAQVARAIADYLAQQNLPSELVAAPHPELAGLPWDSVPLLKVRVGRAQDGDVVGVQQAFAAVAETGTLMLPSGPERPTTLNLLVETEIVVLRASRVVGCYEEAWDLLRAGRAAAEGSGGFMPRNVMLVTGPSRSADIEQTLELGAHGPRRVHVILVEDDAGASAACR